MQISENEITMLVPDNWHVHLRDDERRPFMIRQLIANGWRGRVLVMPNLVPPVLIKQDAQSYEQRIRADIPSTAPKSFVPVMTIQITEKTTGRIISAARQHGIRIAKVYPRDVTTNSEFGVVDYNKIYPALAEAERVGMIVCFHGESPLHEVEGRDKEWRFISDILAPIHLAFPNLKIVLEHITTRFAVDYVKTHSGVTATIAAHYLLTTQDDVIGYTPESGYKGDPHLLCKPMHKWRDDREALIEAAMSHSHKFCYGGDDAPHWRTDKECGHCACGVFNTPVAIPALIKLFSDRGDLPALEVFLSGCIPAVNRGYSKNTETVRFVKKPWVVPTHYLVPTFDAMKVAGEIVPFLAGRTLDWQIAA